MRQLATAVCSSCAQACAADATWSCTSSSLTRRSTFGYKITATASYSEPAESTVTDVFTTNAVDTISSVQTAAASALTASVRVTDISNVVTTCTRHCEEGSGDHHSVWMFLSITTAVLAVVATIVAIAYWKKQRMGDTKQVEQWRKDAREAQKMVQHHLDEAVGGGIQMTEDGATNIVTPHHGGARNGGCMQL
eukprot:TRINITY_DN906_c0_g1_i2.p1 TRINITY_DN906_c0_g1~~TRINITY_DN906_c0_g1_i2.p1  ORF type:complete len:193 (+),score=24.85 TRINITY_DN906_c0_g1_i2:206-784(+)